MFADTRKPVRRNSGWNLELKTELCQGMDVKIPLAEITIRLWTGSKPLFFTWIHCAHGVSNWLGPAFNTFVVGYTYTYIIIYIYGIYMGLLRYTKQLSNVGASQCTTLDSGTTIPLTSSRWSVPLPFPSKLPQDGLVVLSGKSRHAVLGHVKNDLSVLNHLNMEDKIINRKIMAQTWQTYINIELHGPWLSKVSIQYHIVVSINDSRFAIWYPIQKKLGSVSERRWSTASAQCWSLAIRPLDLLPVANQIPHLQGVILYIYIGM